MAADMPRSSNPARPRGLWRARETIRTTPPPSSTNNHHHPDDHHPNKRRRTNDDDQDDHHSASTVDDYDDDHHLSCPSEPTVNSKEFLYWDYSRRCSPHPDRLEKWTTRTRLMDTSSTVNPPLTTHASTGTSTDTSTHPTPLDTPASTDPTAPSSSSAPSAGAPSHHPACQDASEDWEDLKELFTKAAEMYYDPLTPAADTIPLLRGVIHECHRIMRLFPDPTVLFVHPSAAVAGGGAGGVGTGVSGSISASTSTMTTAPKGTVTSAGHSGPNISGGPTTTTTTMQRPSTPCSRDGVGEKRCKCLDLPTAFHTLLGTTLFLFGNLIGQDPTLAMQGEPDSPMPYWLIALDVFELGENLPVRTSGRACSNAPEDWRMAVVWGRTLVCVADEILSRHREAGGDAGKRGVAIEIDEDEDEDEMDHDDAHHHHHDENGSDDEEEEDELTLESILRPSDDPEWPHQSPFAMIKSQKENVLIGGWNSLATSTPHDLMLLAQDQFARGIFHMPHPQHLHRGGRISLVSQSQSSSSFTSLSTPAVAGSTTANASNSNTAAAGGTPTANPTTTTTSTGIVGTFSRSKELYTIASDVLLLSEKLPTPSQRIQWASWADSVLSQMKMELSSSSDPGAMDAWRGVWASARGRALLVVGSGRAEGVEEVLEREGSGEEVLRGEEAGEAREALKSAVEFLGVAIEEMGGSASGSGSGSGEPINNEPHPPPPSSSSSSVSPNPNTDVTTTAEHQQKTESELEELNGLLAEALLTLANLTLDEGERERLYARAQVVGGDRVVLDEDGDEEMMGVDDSD